jgi:hypothetical protein
LKEYLLNNVAESPLHGAGSSRTRHWAIDSAKISRYSGMSIDCAHGFFMVIESGAFLDLSSQRAREMQEGG